MQFDIRYYFCRRGGENIYDMKKNTFELDFDTDTRIAFVKKVTDEIQKNHQEGNSEIITGFMPQIIDPATGNPHKMCPVLSFELYINRLHPDNEFLWQRSLKKKPDNIMAPWYSNERVGHNPLDNFMSTLGKNAKLSQHYTNHCIQVTGVTNLSRQNFTDKQIMSVTGHKSI